MLKAKKMIDTHLTQATITAATFETIFVPILFNLESIYSKIACFNLLCFLDKVYKKVAYSAQKELGVNFLGAPSTFSNTPGRVFGRPDNFSRIKNAHI